MGSFGQYCSLITELGPRWIGERLLHAARLKTGWLRRRTPAIPWSAFPAPPLRITSPVMLRMEPGWAGDAVEEADAIMRGEFRLFSHRMVRTELPPIWNKNQLTGEEAPANKHWTSLGDFSFGDIKGIWELSRFGWAYALARAFARTGADNYRHQFWLLWDDWIQGNPPNQGPNWRCGQEATFRLMAVVFAVEVFGLPEGRRAQVSRFVVVTARRIHANLAYALSQRNNHGISECVGLITAGLWVEPSEESQFWLREGEDNLESQLDELVYADGGFSQHSLIYHRVLLDDLCWCAHRLQRSHRSLPDWLVQPARRALSFLVTITNPGTGRAPLFGANDGARILPVTHTDFLDLRPTIQLASALFAKQLVLAAGPWDEAVHWLGGDLLDLPRANWPEAVARWIAPHAGCVQLVHEDNRLFMRCPEAFVHRPAQADMLHVDVWLGGQPVAHDGGSYSYNSSDRFSALGDAAQHNVILIDNREPLQKFSRFLYLPWPRGKVVTRGATGVRASHSGYDESGVEWTRTISSDLTGGFTVRDSLTAKASHHLRWHWRLLDGPWELAQSAARLRLGDRTLTVKWSGFEPEEVTLQRACSDRAEGWWAPYYGEVESACALIIVCRRISNVEATFSFKIES